MRWSYEYTPYIWPSFLTAVFLIALSAYGWRRRSVPGALPFAIGSLLAALWATGSVLEVAAVAVAAKIFWVRFQAVWQLPAATAISCFLLEYAWPGRWLTRRNLVLLSIVPVLDEVLMLTNDLHHLPWRSFAFDGSVIPQYGPVAWFVIAYSFGLGIINIVVLAWLFLRSPQHRWPVVIMVAGQIAARTVFMLDTANSIHSGLPVDILGIGFLFLMYAIVLFGFRIFDPMPLARKTAIEQLHAGILVLDHDGRVTELNPPAERILGVPASRAKGQLIKELLPAYPDGHLADSDETEIELRLPEEHRDSVGDGIDVRCYMLTIAPLKDWRGLEVGRLLLLRDVTAQKQAQAQIVEQQRALATVNERERMARELHDSLGQVLGYAGFQVEAAAKLSRDGQGQAAAAQLDRLSGMIRDAHADVREYILNLRSAPSLQQPFFTALQHYLEGFTTNYDIQTHLTVGPGLEDKTFSPDAQLHVFRIFQEALSNARKHGQAHHVEVKFEGGNGRVCMTIQDDGRGFAPDKLETASDQHFGLQFMRERAGQLGGCLTVESAPGAGTQVVLEVPRKE